MYVVDINSELYQYVDATMGVSSELYGYVNAIVDVSDELSRYVDASCNTIDVSKKNYMPHMTLLILVANYIDTLMPSCNTINVNSKLY